MNAFADWLFGIILGWTRGLANAGWNLVANHAGGMSDFFSRIWLPLLIVLVVVGSVLDYIIWLVRWKPQRSWRAQRAQRLRDRADRRDAQALEHADMPEDYLTVMSGWVQEDEENMPLPEDFHAAPVADAFVPVLDEPQPEYVEPQPVYAPPAEPEIQIAWRPAAGTAPRQDAVPGQTWPPSGQHPGYPEDMQTTRGERRRRSDRRRGVAGMVNTVRDVLRRNDDDEDDNTPPNSAFREPVYPPAHRPEQQSPYRQPGQPDG